MRVSSRPPARGSGPGGCRPAPALQQQRAHQHLRALRSAKPQPAPGAEAQAFAARLRAGLTAGGKPAVPDHRLALAARTLHDHVVESGYFGERMDGMRRIVDARTGVEVQLAPNRKAVPAGRDTTAAKSCVLCEDTDPLERRVVWRDYWVRPNAYPYVPADLRHMLVMPTAHQPQSFSVQLLGDMLEYQRLVGAEQPVSMFYNGLAGNSQFHLHWQAIHEALPIERAFDDGRHPLKTLRSGPQGALHTFEHSLRSGFLVEGDDAYVSRWAQRIIERLDRDPKTSKDGAGRYNLVLLHRSAGRARLVIFPRHADGRKADLGAKGQFAIGGVNLAGLFVVPRPSISKDYFDVVPKAAGRTVVPPSSLSWCRELAAMPESSLLALRAA